MAGYDGFSKSNNAIDAEDRGLMNASSVAKRIGVTAAIVKKHCQHDEWHHTSSHYNKTEYYDFDNIDDITIKTMQEEHNKIQQKGTTIHHDCKVEWLDWGGSRKYPTCTERLEFGATISVKGQTASIKLKGGKTFKKRLTTNGFGFIESWSERMKNNEAQERANKKAMAAILKRFRTVAKGKKFESCEYFTWRDSNNRDSEITKFKPVTHKTLISRLKLSDIYYANRFVSRLENNHREVVRLGLDYGIRDKNYNRIEFSNPYIDLDVYGHDYEINHIRFDLSLNGEVFTAYAQHEKGKDYCGGNGWWLSECDESVEYRYDLMANALSNIVDKESGNHERQVIEAIKKAGLDNFCENTILQRCDIILNVINPNKGVEPAIVVHDYLGDFGLNEIHEFIETFHILDSQSDLPSLSERISLEICRQTANEWNHLNAEYFMNGNWASIIEFKECFFRDSPWKQSSPDISDENLVRLFQNSGYSITMEEVTSRRNHTYLEEKLSIVKDNKPKFMPATVRF